MKKGIFKKKPYLDFNLQELNIKKLTVTDDKNKYGAHLAAEPDYKNLGERMKGDLKNVVNQIKQLSDKQLEDYQNTGEITVGEHKFGECDLRLMYKFDSASQDTPSNYDAHSDREVLVLMDVTPTQDMMDEGVAREVINRMQKLRKQVHYILIIKKMVHCMPIIKINGYMATFYKVS